MKERIKQLIYLTAALVTIGGVASWNKVYPPTQVNQQIITGPVSSGAIITNEQNGNNYSTTTQNNYGPLPTLYPTILEPSQMDSDGFYYTTFNLRIGYTQSSSESAPSFLVKPASYLYCAKAIPNGSGYVGTTANETVYVDYKVECRSAESISLGTTTLFTLQE